jgi:hypothetical protein
MARATCAALLVLTCMSAACLTYTRADETEPQPAAGQHALGRALRQYVPTEITYSLENGINFPHIVKYKSKHNALVVSIDLAHILASSWFSILENQFNVHL